MHLLAMLLAVAPIATGPGTIYFAGMPPERFRTLASLKVIVTRPESLASFCNVTLPKPPPGQELTLKGCARSDIFGRPYIVIADPCPLGDFEDTARILCHEIAHAAGGWPGDHPL